MSAADPAARIAQLEQTIQTLLGQMAAIQAQQQAAPPPPIVPAPPVATKNPKIVAPKPFDGELINGETFLHQMHLYITGRTNEFPDDNAKIAFALSLMEKKAQPYANAAMEAWEAHQNDPANPEHPPPYAGWVDFKRRFRIAFCDPMPERTAQMKMTALVQGNKTADEYSLEFQGLSAKTGYNETALIEKFEHGMNTALRQKIYSLPHMPTTIDEWHGWACKLDRQWRQFEKGKGSIRPQGQGRQSTTTRPQQQQQQGGQRPYQRPQWQPMAPTTTTSPRDTNAMDVDKNTATRPPVKCFKCGKLGHIARNCRDGLDIRAMEYEDMEKYWKEKLTKQGFSEDAAQ
jgi:hypothetical protein